MLLLFSTAAGKVATPLMTPSAANQRTHIHLKPLSVKGYYMQ